MNQSQHARPESFSYNFDSSHSNMKDLIAPHGSTQLMPLFVENDQTRAALIHEAESLQKIQVSSAAAGNAVMLGAGYFTPLAGFMDKENTLSVAEKMLTSDGLFWPTPVTNLLSSKAGVKVGDRVALTDPNVDGNPVIAIQQIDVIDEYSQSEIDLIVSKVFGTNDKSHPGVAEFLAQGNVGLAGPIQVLNYSYFSTDFPSTFRTAVEIRHEIELLGWKRIVAFQTRNPMHRAHEELCRMAMDRLDADGLVIHMLLGKLKPGDIPAPVREAAISTMVEHYFPPNSALITGYGFDMLYAGPREALLHALFRQNMGATHFIIGRDHAGVGDYYEPFEAQEIFDQIPDDALKIELFKADHTAYSKKLNKVVMMREAPDHTKEDFVLLSGTAVREMLGKGIAPPEEFSRPEVAKILMDHYGNAT